MPHVSDRLLGSRTKKQILDTFDLVLGKMNSTEANTFLFSLLSPTERVMLAKRLAIAMLLNEGIEHAAISEALCVTKETVGRIDLNLLKKPKGYEIAFSKINEDKIMQGMKKALVGLAQYSLAAVGGRVKF